jgi:GNAT superfamily N-acetyltransferase
VQSAPTVLQPAPLESERFGISTARVEGLTLETISTVIQECEANGIRLLIGRCPAASIAVMHALEARGFQLMDTRITFERPLTSELPEDPAGIRPLQPADIGAVEELARLAFAGYDGHFHADPRLDRRACDETYVSWTRRCCHGKAAECVLVMVEEDGIAGFAALRTAEPAVTELVLGAVHPRARGRGVYEKMTVAGLHWAQRSGAQRFRAVTHLTNLAAQRSWLKAGMLPVEATHTLHRWFD